MLLRGCHSNIFKDQEGDISEGHKHGDVQQGMAGHVASWRALLGAEWSIKLHREEAL